MTHAQAVGAFRYTMRQVDHGGHGPALVFMKERSLHSARMAMPQPSPGLRSLVSKATGLVAQPSL